MSYYHFEKDNGKYIWTNGRYFVSFSEGSMEGGSDYDLITDEDSIRYFYYTIEIYRMVNGEKHTIVECRPYEFPSIFAMRGIIEHMLQAQPDDTWSVLRDVDGFIEKRLSYETEGFFIGDYLMLQKTVTEEGFYYEMTIGAKEYCDMGEFICINTNTMHEDNVEEFYKCIDCFIKDTIEKSNAGIIKYTELCSNDKKIVDGRIIVYKVEDDCITDRYDHIVFQGQQNSVCTVRLENGDIVDMNMSEIKEIKEEDVVIVYKDKEYTFNIKDILYISEDILECMLYWNIKMIVDDFVDIMSDSEKASFLCESVEFLQDKFGESIINRSWMCRHEHPFINETIDYDKVKSDIIPVVIQKIKEKLSASL